MATATETSDTTTRTIDQSARVDPRTVMRIKDLQLRAKTVVEGFFSGLHRSPIHGSSVEFSEYRPYTSGDDLRGLDWKLFARSDRYFIKKFEDETNRRVVGLKPLRGGEQREVAWGELPAALADALAQDAG